jgi:hypothetical protein
MKRIIWMFIAAVPGFALAESANKSTQLMDDWLNLEIQKGRNSDLI